MHAEIPQEGDVFQLIEPFGIIDHDGIGRAITKSQVFFKDLLDPVLVAFDVLIRKQGALAVLA